MSDHLCGLNALQRFYVNAISNMLFLIIAKYSVTGLIDWSTVLCSNVLLANIQFKKLTVKNS